MLYCSLTQVFIFPNTRGYKLGFWCWLCVLCRLVTGFPCVQQIFGGGVQENSMLIVARKSNRLQSRLLILCYLEDHAKLQVHQHGAESLPQWSCLFWAVNGFHFCSLEAALYRQCLVCIKDLNVLSLITTMSHVFVYRGYQQQDAHEFMRYLLDHLHRELQYSRNGASHTVSPQDGVRLSTEGKCCMWVHLSWQWFI